MSYEWFRNYNRADIALPSGIGVTLSLVRAQDALIAGSIPLGVLKEMQKIASAAETNGDGKEPEESKESEFSQELIDRGRWFRKEMVRRSIRRIAPSVEQLEGPDDDDVPMWVVEKFDQADFDALVAYALRETPLPAGTQV
jgi:hypothetical protein